MFKKTKFTMEVKEKDFRKFWELFLTTRYANVASDRYNEYHPVDGVYKYEFFVSDLRYRVFRHNLDLAIRLGIIDKFTEETP